MRHIYNMVHSTKGVVLRTLKYGDTSIITSIYTELFGIQQYIVKGVRQSTKTSSGKASYFQPSAILELEVYHNELKQMQFIKEYRWSYLYEQVLFDVVKNTVAAYIIELMQLSLEEPEANPDLYYLIEETLMQLDKSSGTLTGNLPLYFTLHLAGQLGFMLQGTYSAQTPVLDLQEGMFVQDEPTHPYYIEGNHAMITSQILQLTDYKALENIQLNQVMRRQLLESYQLYLSLHISGFGKMKSYAILQEILR